MAHKVSSQNLSDFVKYQQKKAFFRYFCNVIMGFPSDLFLQSKGTTWAAKSYPISLLATFHFLSHDLFKTPPGVVSQGETRVQK